MDQILCYAFLFSLIIFIIQCTFIDSVSAVIGVNYGLLGDNLPSPAKAVSLLQSRNIRATRLFDPNPDSLNALSNSGIEVVLGTLNQDLPQLASNPSFASSWVQTNVLPYSSTIKFRYISAGNEVIPGDLSDNVLPAMQNLKAALVSANLPIPVTTAVSTQVLGSSYPPSEGAFSNEVANVMGPIAEFLASNQSPLLVNVYPYFAYIYNENSISLDYALFQSTSVVVQDESLSYMNLFDAIVDAVYSALEKAGGDGVDIVVSETGWPSAGNGDVATIKNAETYNQNLIKHVCGVSGTPKRPGKTLETYLFALFNEDLKPEGTEQNFGLYHPDMTEVYHVDFSDCSGQSPSSPKLTPPSPSSPISTPPSSTSPNSTTPNPDYPYFYPPNSNITYSNFSLYVTPDLLLLIIIFISSFVFLSL